MSRTSVASALVLSLLAAVAQAEIPTASTPQELAALAGGGGANVKSDDAFTFVILSDRTGGHIAGEWEKAINQINLLRPDFVMCVGDLIEGYTEDRTKIVAQWEEFEQYMSHLAAPFFFAPGNHDVTNPLMREIYLARHGVDGRSWYSFNYRDCHFVVLDSMAMNDPAQFDWLAKDMAAATDARRVLVFYHHPLWDNTEVWPKLAALLPAAKTTIFNGHWHSPSYKLADGIATYVLPATAGITDEGGLRLFAQVTLDGDDLAVALVPMNTLLPLEYLEFAATLEELVQPEAALLSPGGGTYTLNARNPLEQAVNVKIAWEANGWNISPETASGTVNAGGTQSLSFAMAPGQAVTGRPKMTATIEVHHPYLGHTVEIKRTAVLGVRAELTAALRTISIDGRTDDWAGVQPFVLDQGDRIFYHRSQWSGPDDSSCRFSVAADATTLYAVAVIRDDDVWGDSKAPAWFADAVEFMWDTRPDAKRRTARGAGTGQVILTIPTDGGDQPGANWFMNGLPAPQGFRAAYAPREGGYVIELSVPLKQIGLSAPPKAGDVIHIGLLVNDRDHGGAEGWTVSRFSAAGLGNESGNTTGYIRCTFAE